MPCCNGAERGCAARQHHPTRKRADFPLVWLTREPGKQTSGGVADMSAAATLAGAAPERGNTVCLLQASIVKVSSGKRRQAESVRFDCPVVQFFAKGGRELPPRLIGE